MVKYDASAFASLVPKLHQTRLNTNSCDEKPHRRDLTVLGTAVAYKLLKN
jgi:hypothetical protein